MDDEILSRLAAIEGASGHTIIAARDIGSHAWGLASAESDYDIGLIFLEDYNPNAINTRTDTLSLGEYETEDIEFKSWSLRRFAELLAQSNPTALLFARSDISYEREPAAFKDMCEYALETFNPADSIGAYRGKAKSNYWKYLLPTLIQRGENSAREFITTEYETTNADDKGMLTIKPLDNPDTDTEKLHATRLGAGPWTLLKRRQERHTWFIIDPEYDDPAELREADELTARHSETEEAITLATSEIAPADAGGDGDWEFRWGTSDRTIKRYIYIAEALIRADLTACTQTFPPADFGEMLDAYDALDEEERYTNLPLDTLRTYADEKRNGNGSEYTPIPAQDALDAALDDLLEAFQDPANHRDGPERDELNDYLRWFC